MADVVKFYPRDAATDPDNVLEQAIGQYDELLIIGWNKDGNLDPRASLGLKECDMLWMVETFKHKILSGAYDSDGED